MMKPKTWLCVVAAVLSPALEPGFLPQRRPPDQPLRTIGWRALTPNLADLCWYLLQKFIELARTKKESVPVEEEVEVIAALEAGKRSLAEVLK